MEKHLTLAGSRREDTLPAVIALEGAHATVTIGRLKWQAIGRCLFKDGSK